MPRPAGSCWWPSSFRSPRSSPPNGSRGGLVRVSTGNEMLAVDVEKRLGAFTLTARFETTGGATAIFGPSGSGKTSLVNMIAGLIAPDRGRIVLDGVVLFDSGDRINVPPFQRH